MVNFFKNLFTSGYHNHKDAIIIACYFNPQRNEYRKKAFDKWFESIKHLNYFILEGVLEGDVPEIPNHFSKNGCKESIIVPQHLWHKETLLNKIIKQIIEEGKYKYVFWLDTDVIFDNKRWLIDACKELENYNVVQPFEYCFHLNRDEADISRDQNIGKHFINDQPSVVARMYNIWRSFGSNVRLCPKNAMSDDYDVHGHVGFAWGARTEYLKQIGGLYDKALIGGADHIMAHAFVGQIPCSCISKSFGDLEDIKSWSYLAEGENLRILKYPNRNKPLISYVKGNLFHIWHGDIQKREYYKRIKEFTPLSEDIKRDDRGFFVTNNINVTDYFSHYMLHRENIDVFMSEPIMSTGEIINESQFGGGEFGGSGAGSDWQDNPTFS